MINRDESELIARERRNKLCELERPSRSRQWQQTEAANDSDEPAPFRTLIANRTTRYLTERR